jgi:transporter family protein
METDMLSNSMFFAVLAMMLWGVAPLFAKMGLGNLEPIVALTLRSCIITLVLVVAVAVTGKISAVTTAQPREIIFIGLEGLSAALLGQLAYYYALKHGEVSQITPVVAAFPLVAFFLGLIFLGEKVTMGKILGAVLIVAGIVLVNYR